ncbi:hypothetical protein HY486_02480 [Candidatus Woesearchaeota archaeon]|nr:hypothetical protein [Candidatus Woesearchaeota archaeon]
MKVSINQKEFDMLTQVLPGFSEQSLDFSGFVAKDKVFLLATLSQLDADYDCAIRFSGIDFQMILREFYSRNKGIIARVLKNDCLIGRLETTPLQQGYRVRINWDSSKGTVQQIKNLSGRILDIERNPYMILDDKLMLEVLTTASTINSQIGGIDGFARPDLLEMEFETKSYQISCNGSKTAHFNGFYSLFMATHNQPVIPEFQGSLVPRNKVLSKLYAANFVKLSNEAVKNRLKSMEGAAFVELNIDASKMNGVEYHLKVNSPEVRKVLAKSHLVYSLLKEEPSLLNELPLEEQVVLLQPVTQDELVQEFLDAYLSDLKSGEETVRLYSFDFLKDKPSTIFTRTSDSSAVII